METHGEGNAARLVVGALAGLVAGVTASFVMDRFQAAVMALSTTDDDGGNDEEPATQKAADGVVKMLTGHPVDDADKPLAGQAVHYALGIGLGIAYGVAAKFYPKVTTGFGLVFGLGTATLLDEGAVPAAGLGNAPWNVSVTNNIYAYVSHLVFAGTTELVRSQVDKTLRPAA